MKPAKHIFLDKSEWVDKCLSLGLYVSDNYGYNRDGCVSGYWNRNAGEGYIIY